MIIDELEFPRYNKRGHIEAFVDAYAKAKREKNFRAITSAVTLKHPRPLSHGVGRRNISAL